MTDLRVIPENAVLRQDRLHFQRLMQTHIRRFGACPSLTHFEFGFPSDIELHVITDLISALPFLTYLGIYGGTGSYTIVQFETAPARDAFPAHLHEMDISLNGGTGLFFGWLLSHRKPPIFTSLMLSGSARGESIAPIETYLRLHGAAIETLSLQYWVDDLPGSLLMHPPSTLISTPPCRDPDI
ncbi:hypothetical protein B0H11DRAFT_1977792 [Mycena galericulata]|nr:hypothetical protein B0H11DRAFT_1977792 [Mycena galericulata]